MNKENNRKIRGDIMENEFCESFTTIEEAQRKYPSSSCDRCSYKQYDYTTGITSCMKLEKEVMNKNNN